MFRCIIMLQLPDVDDGSDMAAHAIKVSNYKEV